MTAPLVRATLAAAALLPLAACRLDIVRLREGTPLPRGTYEDLEVGRTTLEETLARLGAPERVEWKSGEDYLSYQYGDTVDVGLRLRLPFSIFGYQHNFFRLSENSDYLNTLQLVFDEKRILEAKSFHVSQAYADTPVREAEAGASGGWRLHVTPQVEHSVLLAGDAGVDDYAEVFQNGFRAGVEVGIQPVPVFTFLLSGSFHQYQGDSLVDDGQRLAFGDLDLYQMEAGVRLSIPLSAIGSLGDAEALKRILFDEDLSRVQGFQVYLQGTTGITITSDVRVKVNGASAGRFYDNDALFSGTGAAGLRYAWSWGAAHFGGSFFALDPFNEGNSPLDDDATAFQSFLIGGGLSLQF
jgi:hypothetical protein